MFFFLSERKWIFDTQMTEAIGNVFFFVKRGCLLLKGRDEKQRSSFIKGVLTSNLGKWPPIKRFFFHHWEKEMQNRFLFASLFGKRARETVCGKPFLHYKNVVNILVTAVVKILDILLFATFSRVAEPKPAILQHRDAKEIFPCILKLAIWILGASFLLALVAKTFT